MCKLIQIHIYVDMQNLYNMHAHTLSVCVYIPRPNAHRFPSTRQKVWFFLKNHGSWCCVNKPFFVLWKWHSRRVRLQEALIQYSSVLQPPKTQEHVQECSHKAWRMCPSSWHCQLQVASTTREGRGWRGRVRGRAERGCHVILARLLGYNQRDGAIQQTPAHL